MFATRDRAIATASLGCRCARTLLVLRAMLAPALLGPPATGVSSNAWDEDIRAYAPDFGVELEDARRRLSLQARIGDAGARMEEEPPEE